MPFRVGMITQISHILPVVEPSATDRIEGSSVEIASSGSRQGPVLPTDQHLLGLSPSAALRLPHTTVPVLHPIPHPNRTFFCKIPRARRVFTVWLRRWNT